MSIDGVQDKQKEIAFFDAHAASDEYDVFTPEASARLDFRLRAAERPAARRARRRPRLRIGRIHRPAAARGLFQHRPRHQPQAGRRSAAANIPAWN